VQSTPFLNIDRRHPRRVGSFMAFNNAGGGAGLTVWHLRICARPASKKT
jgi:hypothetical protein